MWASLYRYIFWFLCHPVVKLKCYSVNKHQQHLPCLRKYWNFFNGFLKRLLTSPWFQIISLCLHLSHVLFKKKCQVNFVKIHGKWRVLGFMLGVNDLEKRGCRWKLSALLINHVRSKFTGEAARRVFSHLKRESLELLTKILATIS